MPQRVGWMANIEATDAPRESEFYPSIASYIGERVRDELRDGRSFEIVACGTVDMRDGIRRIAEALHVKSRNLNRYAENARGLFVDLVGVVQDDASGDFTCLICEVKMGRPTLTNLAQLLGYCVASNARHGLLVSIGHSITAGLEAILRNNRSLIDVRRTDGFRHSVGIASWIGSELRFDDIGFYRSVESLARDLDRSV